MIYILLFFLSIFCYTIIINYNHFKKIYRLLKKLLFPIKYNLEKQSAYNYPLPPYPNTWYPICFNKKIKKNKKYLIKVTGKEFIFFRNENNVILGINRHCPHMGVDLCYGKINKNCIVCPMHNKYVSGKNNKIFVEESHNIVFMWIGDLVNDKPPIKIDELFQKNDMENINLLPYFHFTHNVGGNLIDYAEHLLDIKHAPYIHKAEIIPIENGLKTTKYSFITTFGLKNTDINPVFTYITPTFGNVKYIDNCYVSIMFKINEINNIDMIIMPSWKGNFTFYKLFISFIFSLYTYIDFSDEAAFFSTKNHNIRDLNKDEKPMDDFRKWYINNYYTKDQLDNFYNEKNKFEKFKLINDW